MQRQWPVGCLRVCPLPSSGRSTPPKNLLINKGNGQKFSYLPALSLLAMLSTKGHGSGLSLAGKPVSLPQGTANTWAVCDCFSLRRFGQMSAHQAKADMMGGMKAPVSGDMVGAGGAWNNGPPQGLACACTLGVSDTWKAAHLFRANFSDVHPCQGWPR